MQALFTSLIALCCFGAVPASTSDGGSSHSPSLMRRSGRDLASAPLPEEEEVARFEVHATGSSEAINELSPTASTHPLASLFVVRAAGGVKQFLPIGHVVAIYNKAHSRFARMTSNQDMEVSDKRAETDFVPTWSEERFLLVDGGGDKIAFHNKHHNRFISMPQNSDMAASAAKGADELPDTWTQERFTPVEAGGGNIAFHCSSKNAFVRMYQLGSKILFRAKAYAKDKLPQGDDDYRFKIIDFGYKDPEVNYPYATVYAKEADVTELEANVQALREVVKKVKHAAEKAGEGISAPRKADAVVEEEEEEEDEKDEEEEVA